MSRLVEAISFNLEPLIRDFVDRVILSCETRSQCHDVFGWVKNMHERGNTSDIEYIRHMALLHGRLSWFTDEEE